MPMIRANGIDISAALSDVDGCMTSVYAATAPGIENLSGGCFDNSKPAPVSEFAQSKEEENKIWAASLKLIGLSDSLVAWHQIR